MGAVWSLFKGKLKTALWGAELGCLLVTWKDLIEANLHDDHVMKVTSSDST